MSKPKPHPHEREREPPSSKHHSPSHYEERNGNLKTNQSHTPDHAQQHHQSNRPNHAHHQRGSNNHNHNSQQQHYNDHSQHNSPRHHHPQPPPPPPPSKTHTEIHNQSRSKKDSSPRSTSPPKEISVLNGGIHIGGGGNKVHVKELQLDSLSDKENQNTWFVPNQHHYADEHPIGSTIPVIPLFTPVSTTNPADFHQNGHIQNHHYNSNGAANHHPNNIINYPNYHIPISSPSHHLHTPISPISTATSNNHHPHYIKHGHVKRNNFVGYDKQQQDLLSMGRIQELRDRMGADRTKMTEKALWKCLGAEFLGTSLLLFLGIGCALKMEHEVTKQLSFVGVALCWGFTVATIAQALGGVSADLNPAITLSCMVTGKIPVVKALMYVLMQCLGALAGTSLLKAVTPDTIEGEWGITRLAPGVTPLQGCVVEIVSTFLLCFTVFSVNDENRNDVKGSVPLAVGICVAAIVMCSGPLTGASLNPARSLGPSIVAGRFDDHWIYWIGPILGAVAAGLIYTHIFRALRPDEVEALEAEQQLKDREREAKENVGSPAV